MSCCGNKKDVNRVGTSNAKHKSVRATKFMAVDDSTILVTDSKGFAPIR